MIRSYGKVYALGHRAVKELFFGPVIVQEKLDGSQFSFQKDKDGLIHFRSKRCDLQFNDAWVTNKMFDPAVQYILSVKNRLVPGWTYRAEVLTRPRHNTLCYERVPKNFIYLYDIDKGMEDYAPFTEVQDQARHLQVEPPHMLSNGDAFVGTDRLDGWLKQTSVLGGPNVEGIVLKNYTRFGIDGRALMGKYVSEAFKETHGKVWKNKHPGDNAIKDRIVSTYRTDARWDKAYQSARDAGELLGEPRDIPVILKRVSQDILSECREEIAETLWKWAWKDISRGCVKGLAEWYKRKLAEAQFEKDNWQTEQEKVVSISNGTEVKT